MKNSITNIFNGLAMTVVLVFGLVSCQKEQNLSSEKTNPLAQELQFTAENAQTATTGCEEAIPSLLDVPAGNRLSYRVYATGVQIYQVRRSTTNPNQFLWVNTAPRADLFIQQQLKNQVGTHYAGPSWEFMQGPYKGEKVVASKLQGVTVDPTAVPWLLLKALDAQSSPGNQISYIQRVCTTGGLAPSVIPNESNLGQVEEVPYTATYLFFEAAHPKE